MDRAVKNLISHLQTEHQSCLVQHGGRKCGRRTGKSNLARSQHPAKALLEQASKQIPDDAALYQAVVDLAQATACSKGHRGLLLHDPAALDESVRFVAGKLRLRLRFEAINVAPPPAPSLRPPPPVPEISKSPSRIMWTQARVQALLQEFESMPEEQLSIHNLTMALKNHPLFNFELPKHALNNEIYRLRKAGHTSRRMLKPKFDKLAVAPVPSCPGAATSGMDTGASPPSTLNWNDNQILDPVLRSSAGNEGLDAASRKMQEALVAHMHSLRDGHVGDVQPGPTNSSAFHDTTWPGPHDKDPEILANPLPAVDEMVSDDATNGSATNFIDAERGLGLIDVNPSNTTADAGQGEVRQGEAAQGEAAQGEAAQGEAAQGEAGLMDTISISGISRLTNQITTQREPDRIDIDRASDFSGHDTAANSQLDSVLMDPTAIPAVPNPNVAMDAQRETQSSGLSTSSISINSQQEPDRMDIASSPGIPASKALASVEHRSGLLDNTPMSKAFADAVQEFEFLDATLFDNLLENAQSTLELADATMSSNSEQGPELVEPSSNSTISAHA